MKSKSKKSLLDEIPVGIVKNAEWIDSLKFLEITLYDENGKDIAAKLRVLRGKSPEILFYEVGDSGKLKLLRKFLIAGKNDGIVSSISNPAVKKSTNSVTTKVKRQYNRRTVPVTEVSTNVSVSVTKGNKSGPKTREAVAKTPIPATEKVENVKKEVIKKAPKTPKVVTKKDDNFTGPWTFKDNYLKMQPLQKEDLSLNFDQFVNSFIPKSSQVRVLQTLTEIMSRYGDKDEAWNMNAIISIIKKLPDGPKTLLANLQNSNGIIPIAHYAPMMHLFSKLISDTE